MVYQTWSRASWPLYRSPEWSSDSAQASTGSWSGRARRTPYVPQGLPGRDVQVNPYLTHEEELVMQGFF